LKTTPLNFGNKSGASAETVLTLDGWTLMAPAGTRVIVVYFSHSCVVVVSGIPKVCKATCCLFTFVDSSIFHLDAFSIEQPFPLSL
jgi:hypothetical protein